VTCRSRGAPRGRGGGFILAALALLAAGCGSTAHLSAKASVPTLAVSPSTGLVGGESLHVDISGFPPRATLALFECAGTPPAGAFSCGGTQLLTLYTGHGSTASGTLVAQPAAGTAGSTTSTTPCTGQCVLVAAVEKLATELPPFSEPDATAPLSFSTTATPGLADAWLQDLSWLSPSEGWALAAQPCAAGTCARLARTTDGGEHWEPLPSVPAQVGAVDCSQVACVSDVAFASSTVGYLYGPALLMTTDGGYSWRLQPGLQVEVLAAAGGRVYRVAYEHGGCSGPCNPELQEAAIGSSAWHTVVGQLAYAGRSSGQIVGYAPSLLFALYGNLAMGYSPAVVYRSTDGGASWKQTPDPCGGQQSTRTAQPLGLRPELTDLAAAPGGFFAGLCTTAENSRQSLVTSTDGGATWRAVDAIGLVQAGALAAASPTTLAATTSAIGGGNGTFTAEVSESTDGGHHWIAAATDAQPVTVEGIPASVGFETTEVGWWIGDPHSVWTTRDGGRQWTKLAFG
jgi:photosystem II stability/assembly factor-like uncharacterized protein